ncbi:MAG: GNAT family N-acetyltransferase [Flavobacteriaceae bacterium]
MEREKEIRAVTGTDDIALVVALADSIWREHYTPIIGRDQVDYMLLNFQSAEAIKSQIDEGASYYLLLLNNSPAGYFSFYLKESELFLSKIYLRKSLRGKGLGGKMLDFIQDEAANNGLKQISLTVNKNNTKTIAAYSKLGFRKVKPLVIDIGNGFVMDDFLMEKSW